MITVSSTKVCIATPKDEAAIRELLSQQPMVGDVQLAVERQPSVLRAMQICGDRAQVLVGRELQAGTAVATIARSEYPAYLNGTLQRVGYVSLLRILQHARRWPHFILDVAQLLDQLRSEGDAQIHIVSVMASNVRVRRFLEPRTSRFFPTSSHCGRFTTLVLGPTTKPRNRTPQELVTATEDDLEQIAECLQRYAARYQFARHWSAEDLLSDQSTPGLAPSDFLLVKRQGRVAGCVAIWDQSSFKQIIVRSYTPRVARWRGLTNMLGGLLGIPPMPNIGELLRQAYLSHLAIDDDDPFMLHVLLAETLRRAHRRGLEYLTLGLDRRSPLYDAIRSRYRARRYENVLYRLDWSTEQAVSLDDRPRAVELATL